jgi:hypothetical protein
MTWAHASKLQNILDFPGLKIQEFIENLWELLQNQVNPEQLNLDSELWNDVLHPSRFDRIVVAVHGLASLLQDQSSEVLIQAGVIERIQSFAVKTVEEHRVPNPQLFRDPMLSRDGLSSILGGDRGNCLAPIIGSDVAQHLQSASLKSIIEGALQKLESDPSDSAQWSWLNAIVGDLPVYEELRGSLKEIILESKISTWFKLNHDLGILALDVASNQSRYMDDEKVQAHLENQLLSLAKIISEGELNGINENVLTQLIETIFKLSIKPDDLYKTSQNIANLIIKMVAIWPRLSDTYIYLALFKLIQELPVEQLHGFWKALLHLRALRSLQV